MRSHTRARSRGERIRPEIRGAVGPVPTTYRGWRAYEGMKIMNPVCAPVASRVTLVSLLFLAAGCSPLLRRRRRLRRAGSPREGVRGGPKRRLKETPLPDVPSPYDALPAESRAVLDKPFTGDLDEMVKRRLIRAGVVYNRTQYFIDHGVQRGISYESIKLFEEQLNKRLKTGLLKVHVAIVPIARDQLFPALAAGKVDFIAAALTITPDRKKLVDFSTPTRTGVSEIVVTAPDVPAPATVDDLSGREVFVRKKQQLLRKPSAS